MSDEKKIQSRYLIAAGGTGGHLIPAQNLAKKLIKKKNVKILFAAHKLSNCAYFDREKFSYKEIASSPIYKNWKIFSSLFFLSKGLIQAYFCIWKFKPNVVIGFGSYHTFPVLLAAKLLGKKVILFEANTSLGKVNRLFSKSCHKLALQFPLMNEKAPSNAIFIKPLPWEEKKKISSKKTDFFGLDENLFTILIMGGSQGAKFINELMKSFVKSSSKKNEIQKFQLIHLCGNQEEEKKLKKLYSKNNILSYVKSFEKDMLKIWQNSDLVIARSGASTIAEILAYEIPCILIPFPYSTEEHQVKNATFVQDIVKGGVMCEEKALTFNKFIKLFYAFMDKKNMQELKKNIQTYKKLKLDKNTELLWDLIAKTGKKNEN